MQFFQDKLADVCRSDPDTALSHLRFLQRCAGGYILPFDEDAPPGTAVAFRALSTFTVAGVANAAALKCVSRAIEQVNKRALEDRDAVAQTFGLHAWSPAVSLAAPTTNPITTTKDRAPPLRQDINTSSRKTEMLAPETRRTRDPRREYDAADRAGNNANNSNGGAASLSGMDSSDADAGGHGWGNAAQYMQGAYANTRPGMNVHMVAPMGMGMPIGLGNGTSVHSSAP